MKSWTMTDTVTCTLGAANGIVAGQLAKTYEMGPIVVGVVTAVTAFIVAWVASKVLGQ